MNKDKWENAHSWIRKDWKDAKANSWPHSVKLNYLLALRHVYQHSWLILTTEDFSSLKMNSLLSITSARSDSVKRNEKNENN